MPEEIRSLPTSMFLVKAGGRYRLVWSLGSGLGWAWYTARPEQLENLMGEGWESQVQEEFDSQDIFKAKYGAFHWGNIAEMSLTADSPWDDLRDRILRSFGPVAGLDEDEIKRLVLQGYAETWSQQEFLAHYRQTRYFNRLNDAQREWAVLSKAERAQRVTATMGDLISIYRNHWGIDPTEGFNDEDLVGFARKVARGALTIDEVNYFIRREAEQVEDTPAHRRRIEEVQETGERVVTIENLQGFVEDQWREWVGPYNVPTNFARDWANKLFLNQASDEDLENILKSISANRWANKPEDVTWDAWAAIPRGDIQSLLELPHVPDDDPLLRDILEQGLAGRDAYETIRADERFRYTSRMEKELSSTVSDIGRMFGMIT